MFFVLAVKKLMVTSHGHRHYKKEKAPKLLDISQFKRCYCESATFCPVNQCSYYTCSCQTGLTMKPATAP